MDRPVLTARIREEAGKGAARKLRKSNQIPGVFYGRNTEVRMLAVDYPELQKILNKATSDNIIIGLRFQSGKKTETKQALLKELQTDPIKDTYLHVDFYEVSMDRKITVNVPIHLVNTPQGAEEGGILEQIRRELPVSCLPDRIMEYIEVDVSDLNIGDAVHVGDLDLPEGVEAQEEDHLAVAVVSVPKAEPVEEMVEEEVAEEMEGVETEEGAPEGEETETSEKGGE